MEPIVFKISSNDDTFLDFYGPLARTLQGFGTVYTPYPVIPPDVRTAVPLPTEVLVTLKSIESANLIRQTMRDYLEGYESRKLILEIGDRTLSVVGSSLPEVLDLMDDLLLRTQRR
jgi:hypothetical protein